MECIESNHSQSDEERSDLQSRESCQIWISLSSSAKQDSGKGIVFSFLHFFFTTGKSGSRSGHQSRLPLLLQMLYVGWVSVDLNLTSRVFSRHSGLPPSSKSTAIILVHKFISGLSAYCHVLPYSIVVVNFRIFSFHAEFFSQSSGLGFLEVCAFVVSNSKLTVWSGPPSVGQADVSTRWRSSLFLRATAALLYQGNVCNSQPITMLI